MQRLITVFAITIAACSREPTSNEAIGANDTIQATSTATADAVAGPVPRVITCHELIGGKPSPEAITYQLVGDKLYAHAPGGERRLISAAGQLINLGRSQDDEGPRDSLASHTLQGDVLTRTVLWQRPTQAPRTAFVERYDFAKQTVIDAKTGEDSCYHTARPDGRTQEQAEWEALSGTGRGDEWSSNAE